MKSKLLIAGIIATGSFLLAGCINYVTDCNNCNNCTVTCTKKTPCGTTIVRRCAPVCDPCHFRERTCSTCWTCLNQNTED